jgi:hypothetical protein
MEKLSCCLLIFYYLYVVLLYINRAVKRCLKKINSEITLKYFCLTLKYFRLLPVLNMKFP